MSNASEALFLTIQKELKEQVKSNLISQEDMDEILTNWLEDNQGLDNAD